MRVLSLFSGVGGFDMGLEAAGMTTVFQCEIDRHARAVLDYHWPDVPKWDDVTTLTGAHILAATGGVDLVAWGSPCQDLSLAGKRAGLSGERSGLFHEGVRIIKELRELSNGQYPRWSLWENVVGALSSNGGADFGEVLHEMDEAGACFSEWVVLDAQYFGVPQRRRRVFVASCFDSGTGERCGSPLFPVAKSLSGDSAKGRTKGKGTTGEVASSLRVGSGVGERGDGSDNLIVRETQDWVGKEGQWAAGSTESGVLTTSVTSKWYKGTGGPSGSEHYNLVVEPATDVEGSEIAATLRGFGHGWQGQHNSTNAVAQPETFVKARRAQAVAQENNGIIGSDVVGSLAARDWKGVGNQYVQENKLVVEEPVVMWQREGKPGGGKGPLLSDSSLTLAGSNDQTLFQPIGFSHTQGLSAQPSEDAFPTLRSGGGGMAVQTGEPNLVVRRLTPLECERLMGWSDNHTAIGVNGPISDTNRYKMCGNGVASPVAAWLGKHLMNVRSDAENTE